MNDLNEMPTRKEVLMRSANLLNDFAFKYVFGEDCKEANDALKSLLTVFLERSVNKVVVKNSEMVKVDLNKPLEVMNEQEKMIYYFLNCHKGMEDSKIKMMIESDEVIQMLEKRVETISDDRWKKIIEDFQKLHENEERIELQLELEELQKAKKKVRKAQEDVRKEQEDVRKEQEDVRKAQEDVRKAQEDVRKQVEEADKKVEDANRQIEQMNQVMKQGIKAMLANGMSLEFVSKSLSKSEDEIMELLK